MPNAVSAEAHFRAVAPPYMRKFMADFDASELDAAAVFGNLGHESKGLTDDQEDKPLAGRGGRNWSQWTGERRVAFEAYCARAGKDPDSDEAAYAYLYLELKGIEGSEGRAIAKLKAADGLEAKVKAFELAYLRAHKKYKHYASRLKWAEIALDALRSAPATQVPEEPFSPRTDDPPGKGDWLTALIAFVAKLLAAIFRPRT